jgi:hypothetical protein
MCLSMIQSSSRCRLTVNCDGFVISVPRKFMTAFLSTKKPALTRLGACTGMMVVREVLVVKRAYKVR